MTKLLEKALEAVRRRTANGRADRPEDIDRAHLPAVLEGLVQATRRELATDAEVKAAFRRFER
jgi:hypothetical protein